MTSYDEAEIQDQPEVSSEPKTEAANEPPFRKGDSAKFIASVPAPWGGRLVTICKVHEGGLVDIEAADETWLAGVKVDDLEKA